MSARTLPVLAALLLALAVTAAAPDVAAREAVLGMSARVFKAMQEAQEQVDEKNYEEGLRLLEELRERYLSAYETTQVLRLTGLIHYQADRYASARAAFEEALAQDRVPEPLQADLLGILGRLGLMMDDNEYAVGRFRELLAIPEHDTPDNLVLLANALLRQERYLEALGPLERAIAEEREAGRAPREDWLGMLSSIHYQQEDFEAMREAVRELAERYPRDQYLMNLAALHGQLGDRAEQLSLVQALADAERLSEGSHLKMLASLFLAEELPYKAASLLETSIERGAVEADQRTLEQLSQAWYLAQEWERAIPPLEQAAAMAENGEIYLRLAGLHMDAYRWEEAAAAAELALERGGLREEGRAWLLQGMAQVNQERYGDAIKSFQAAGRFDETKAYAQQWQNYVVDERRKQELLP